MPIVKLCGYLTRIDKFQQYYFKLCDEEYDTQNTKYKIFQLNKMGGDSPISRDVFVTKTKKNRYPTFYNKEKNMVESKDLLGTLVEVELSFRKYNFNDKYGWSLDLLSATAI